MGNMLSILLHLTAMKASESSGIVFLLASVLMVPCRLWGTLRMDLSGLSLVCRPSLHGAQTTGLS